MQELNRMTTGRTVALAKRVAAHCLALLWLIHPTPGVAEDVVVSLWGTGMVGTPYAVAMKNGYFKEAGVTVTGVIGGNGGGNVLRAVLANGLPYGEVATPAVIAAQQQGLPVVAVNGGALAADNAWVTMPSSKLSSIKDLVGKKVAYTTPKSISEAFLLASLRRNGVDPASVALVAAGGIGQGLTMLENGAVDAALIVQPLQTIRRGKYKQLFAVKDTLPPVMSNMGITTREFAAKNPDKLRALIEGRRKGVDFIYANPEEAGRILAEAYDMRPDVCIEAVKAMVQAKYWVAGEFELQLVSNLVDNLRLTGAVTGDVEWQTLVNTSLLPADLRSKSRLTAN